VATEINQSIQSANPILTLFPFVCSSSHSFFLLLSTQASHTQQRLRAHAACRVDPRQLASRLTLYPYLRAARPQLVPLILAHPIDNALAIRLHKHGEGMSLHGSVPN
jgi:hypothetical protein